MQAAAPLLVREPVPTLPAHAWAPCSPDELDAILAQGGWSLVEFWTPSSLFSRLLAPVRVGIAATHAARLRLLCCVDDALTERFVTFGATALPAVLLFEGRRRVRRWLGATDVSLLRLELDAALADAQA
jgi:thioredoxin-like negative regulator of GroEL